VLVLFFVILIGVVNTMRMSIRERTREIGTNRAIGMQRSDVRSVFVLEIVFLAVFACIAGIVVSYGVMALLGVPTFDLKDNPFSMFFVNKHLYFVPTVGAIIVNFLIIVIVSFLIAFFTARRAARLRVADALRHFE
jgi:ABC-type antimicrobial peptide transport system permease subunit